MVCAVDNPESEDFRNWLHLQKEPHAAYANNLFVDWAGADCERYAPAIVGDLQNYQNTMAGLNLSCSFESSKECEVGITV